MNQMRPQIKYRYLIAVLLLTGAWYFSTRQRRVEQEDHTGHDHSKHEAEATIVNTDHDEDDGRADHDEDEGMRLNPEQKKNFGIVVSRAGAGDLINELRLPGEIVFNEDRVVHLVPRVAGVVRKISKTVGDRVEEGEIIAVIDSRELADAKAEYLAAKARTGLVKKSFEREKLLREKEVSSEQDYLEAELAMAEARINLRSAQQKLHALGLSVKAVEILDGEDDKEITRYEIKAPISGVITERHITLGESLSSDTGIFTVVDTSTVWVKLAVYTKNLNAVQKGQEVSLKMDHSGAQACAKIVMVAPFVEKETRSAVARIVLDNSDGRWMPGTFVTGTISTSRKSVAVIVPRQAVQIINGNNVVFIEHEGAFEMTPVTIGHSDQKNVEILKGLKSGDAYVEKGAFELKATVITSNLDAHAGHGH